MYVHNIRTEWNSATRRDSLSETVSLDGLFDVSVRAVSYAAFVSEPYFSLNQTILQACSQYFLCPVANGCSCWPGLSTPGIFASMPTVIISTISPVFCRIVKVA